MLRKRPSPPTNPNLKTSHAAGLHLLGFTTGGYIPKPDENRVSRIAARYRAACEYCLWPRTSVSGLRRQSSSVKSYPGQLELMGLTMISPIPRPSTAMSKLAWNKECSHGSEKKIGEDLVTFLLGSDYRNLWKRRA